MKSDLIEKHDGWYLDGERLAPGRVIEVDHEGNGTWHRHVLTVEDLDDGHGAEVVPPGALAPIASGFVRGIHDAERPVRLST
jgi:hypothetical protein